MSGQPVSRVSSMIIGVFSIADIAIGLNCPSANQSQIGLVQPFNGQRNSSSLMSD
jgi:hypothetical protein